LGDTEITAAKFIAWQYFDNPSGHAIMKIAKTESNEVVGQCAWLPMTVKVFDNQVKAGAGSNAMTKETHQRQGIFSALVEETCAKAQKEECQLFYAYPNMNSFLGCVAKNDFSILHHIPLLIYPSGLRALVKRKTNGFLAFFAPSFLFRLDKKSNDANVKEMHPDDWPLLKAFWEVVKNKYPIMVVRDEAFLQWRYFAVPAREYKMFVYKKDGAVMGYIVATVKEANDTNYGMIVDFLLRDGETKAGQELVWKCFELFKQKQVQLITCLMLVHTQEYSILRKCGFFKGPAWFGIKPTPLIYRVHHRNQDTEQMKDIKNWFFTMGDYDSV
jgi:predicted N-acetyltransferase YhbS